MSGFGLGAESNVHYYSAFTRHSTKKGPGGSKGVKLTAPGSGGRKLVKKAFLGTCALRNGVGAAGRLALEGKLCKK